MTQLQLNKLMTFLVVTWHHYGKQILAFVLIALMLVSLVDPNMTVLANGSSSNTSAGGG